MSFPLTLEAPRTGVPSGLRRFFLIVTLVFASSCESLAASDACIVPIMRSMMLSSAPMMSLLRSASISAALSAYFAFGRARVRWKT